MDSKRIREYLKRYLPKDLEVLTWSIFKRRPKTSAKAEYIFFNHTDEEQYIGFQFILTGLLSVYYDGTRNFISRPGFTAFPSYRNCNKKLGVIKTKGMR